MMTKKEIGEAVNHSLLGMDFYKQPKHPPDFNASKPQYCGYSLPAIATLPTYEYHIVCNS